MRKQLAIESTLLVIAILVTACNMPFGAEQEAPTPIPTVEPEVREPEPEVEPETDAEPTQEPAEVEQPQGTPIEHIEPGALILITNIHMLNQERGWGIGGLNGASDHIFRTNDGGKTWLDVTPPEPVPAEGLSKAAVGTFLSPMMGWIVYYPGGNQRVSNDFRVWSTMDGGETWTPSSRVEIGFIGSSDYPPILEFEDADNGWLVAREGPTGMHKYHLYLLRTSDGGRNWETAVTPRDPALQSCRKSGVDFGDLKTGWATLADCPIVGPALEVTQDGGRTWQVTSLPAPDNRPKLFESELCEGHSPQLISALQGALGVTCRTGLKLNYIYVTNDGGKSWQSHLYPGGDIRLLSDRTAYALGRHIYQTLNGGETWEHVKTVQWDGQFSFVNDQVGWAVARQGDALALVTTSNGGRTWDLLKPAVAS